MAHQLFWGLEKQANETFKKLEVLNSNLKPRTQQERRLLHLLEFRFLKMVATLFVAVLALAALAPVFAYARHSK